MELADLMARAAAAAPDSIEQTLWVTALVDAALGQDVVLIGGAAQKLYTGDHRPTDIDLAAPGIDRAAFRELTDAGFTDLGPGHRHIALELGEDQPPVLIEFPTSGGDIDEANEVQLADDVVVRVISPEELVVDRLIRATDGTAVTFDDAVALVVATFGDIDWSTVATRVEALAFDGGLADLPGVQERVLAAARRVR